MPKPPVDPGYFDKVNYVIDSWTNACEAPWYIYIETMLPAALEAFITLMTFGWDDVIRGYWRPRGLRSRRHGRKGRKGRRFPRLFPEIGEEIGKRLPGAEKVKGRKWKAGGVTLWRIDGVAQRILFWWLVVDVTVDFAFNWTSLLYQTEWCKNIALGRFSYQNTLDNVVPMQHWTTIPYDSEDYEQGPPSWGFIRGNTGSVYATVAAAIQVEPTAGGPPITAIAIRIVEHGTNKILKQTGPQPPDDPLDPVSLASAGIPPFTTFRCDVWIEGANGRMDGGAVTGMEIEA